MEGACTTETTIQEAEINELSEQFQSGLKIIKNIGDFSYVIDVKILHSDLKMKFQLEESYPKVVPNIILQSTKLSVFQRQKLTQHLNNKASSLIGKNMINVLVHKAQEWMKENVEDWHVVKGESEVKSHQKKPKNGNKKKRTQEKEDTSNEKKASMRTAEDVISRIQWDDQLPNESFIVGYLDRFLGIQEKYFSAFSWEDLSTVDLDTLAIPKHRIQYFKYKDLKVWDKKKRLDNVFGSTGSGTTIYEAMEKYDAEHKPTLDDTTESDSSDSSDEDDDDIELGLGEFQDGSDEEFCSRREQYWGKKSRPTHFIALRVTNETVREKVGEAHERILQIKNEYENCLLPKERLHITLCCLGLDTEEQLENAVKAFKEMKDELASWDPKEISLDVGKVNNFFHHTLYASIKANQAFFDFINHMKICFKQKGIEIRDVFEFTPHMTLLKIKTQQGIEMKSRFIDPRIYGALENLTFGKQTVDAFHLCKMSEEQENGFYISPASISF